ncbi:MAG: HEAT repeat domain-containing protein [Treponema sp.]|nr:HEAT repeat domain-containing protein [Treponema sp.]
MKLLKSIACGAGLLLLAGAVFAQNRGSETSVEELYLSNVQDVIITELAHSQDYDNKLVALQYLEESVKDGTVTEEQRAAMQSLAGEGVTTKARTNGRLVNNFPDIRAKACDLLGKVPSKESKDTLLTITTEDTEPMVVSAAVRSLGEIGMNDNDEVLAAIEFIQHKYAALNPTSSLAFDILSAYEKLAPTAVDRNALIQSISEIAANYRFATPVRLKALSLLRDLQANKK